MRIRSGTAGERGMTLIEVIVSFAIISMLVMSFYSIFSQSVKQTADEQYADQALQVSRAAMDQFRSETLTKNSISLFGQDVDVTGWKNPDSNFPITVDKLYYPSAERPLFKIRLIVERLGGQVQLSLLPPANPSLIPTESQANSGLPPGKSEVSLAFDQFFRKLTVEVTDPNMHTLRYETILTVR